MAGFVQVSSEDRCPCGSGESYASCCGAVLRGAAAETAVALMRSRYTAFVVGDARYLAATWHPGTAPEHLDLDPHVRWLGLDILDTDAGQPGDRKGTVEFRARYRGGDLHERSRFVWQSGRWWYLDGAVS